MLEAETFEESIKLLNSNIELPSFFHQVVHQVVHQLFTCHQFSQTSVISSIAKDDHLFKIYQSDLTKNWSMFSLSKDKSTSVLDASFLETVIFSHGAKTVLLETELETSTNQVTK
jgi:hypothetical protein